MDDNKFWLFLWVIALAFFVITICGSLYIIYDHIHTMAKEGYVQKLVVIRPGSFWVLPITEKVWVKKGEELITFGEQKSLEITKETLNNAEKQ